MPLTIAAIGCSGPVASVYIKGFLNQNQQIKIRLLTRTEKDFPDGVEAVLGSMMNPSDVSKAMEGVDAAFLLTPMTTCNQTDLEIAAAKSVIEGAKQANLKHLIYTSVLGADQPRWEVGILNAKYEIEKLLRESGLPCTILRCGTYMQDVFDPRIELLNRGIYLFPINPCTKITYTSQEDVPKFVVDELLAKKKILGSGKPLNFVSINNTHSVQEVGTLLSQASGFTIRVAPKFPLFYLFKVGLPFFDRTKHRFSSVIPLLDYFDQCGYTVPAENDNGTMLESEFPQFKVETMQEHLATLWPENNKK